MTLYRSTHHENFLFIYLFILQSSAVICQQRSVVSKYSRDGRMVMKVNKFSGFVLLYSI